ncbi:MAG TPA: ferritin-like domain-containing protein [Thiobacillus sp.]|nr:MAG: bacterioferritin [Hydrogenophilales bacterium 28-61-11]OYZ56769.1 MAG: bacterioferritin [Hydrogenophilales bacterium 16-61-112]OZA48899.1 MAG: bacterioferritin [Hydrogenophilales bacterium 17-61-76]HQT30018.1 ferritin-like domain-containing protein [Thiobacillus sp.]HQT70926.1 ferritin-like domain-containing protein [Thiobacillus sp.]
MRSTAQSALNQPAAEAGDPSAFLTDIKTLRARARQQIDEGAVTHDYGLNAEVAVSVLNAALATELICTLRYRQHAVMAKGIHAEPIAQEFLVHSNEELAHADLLAKRIVQLGGKPEMEPAKLGQRSHSEYTTCDTLEEMIRENLVAERIAIESYREMISYFAQYDPTTRTMLEGILAIEEDHADELADLLHA